MQSTSTRLPQSKASTFEFTKRKRWADLLVTELAEAIILILNSQCQILYCGAAISELLGWRDDELVDGDFVDLINVDDKTSFQNGFRESIRTRSDMLSYTRLHCKNEYITHQDYSVRPKEVLFEINGYPHFLEGDNECKCFFAMAKPYPSRNTAMLNTFLELKMENEKLQQKLQELRTKNLVGMSPMAGPSPGHLHYATSSSSPAMSMRVLMATPTHMSPASSSLSEFSGAMYAVAPSHSAGGFEYMVPRPVSRVFDATSLRDTDDDGHSEPARKKQKKLYSSEQHVCVTCGRTDSPEWRKGPHGPKTLCNACGLRWAKKMRKFDDPTEGGVAQDSGQTPLA